MRQSYELYFIANLLADIGLLTVTARTNGCFNIRRILLTGTLTALYALLAEAFFPALSHPIIQLVLIPPIAMLACGEADRRQWFPTALQLFCAAMLAGGVITFCPSISIPVVYCAALLVISALFTVRRQRLLSWDVMLQLSLNRKTISFRALIDTGNRLREPISGLPVLIVEEALLQSILSPDTAYPPCRQVSFGGLGGTGTIRCFRPDSIMIRRGNQLLSTPPVWVAVYPGRIPGSARALAPPSFAVIPGTAPQQILSKGVHL